MESKSVKDLAESISESDTDELFSSDIVETAEPDSTQDMLKKPTELSFHRSLIWSEAWRLAKIPVDALILKKIRTGKGSRITPETLRLGQTILQYAASLEFMLLSKELQLIEDRWIVLLCRFHVLSYRGEKSLLRIIGDNIKGDEHKKLFHLLRFVADAQCFKNSVETNSKEFEKYCDDSANHIKESIYKSGYTIRRPDDPIVETDDQKKLVKKIGDHGNLYRDDKGKTYPHHLRYIEKTRQWIFKPETDEVYVRAGKKVITTGRRFLEVRKKWFKILGLSNKQVEEIADRKILPTEILQEWKNY